MRLGRVTGLNEPMDWSTTGDRTVSLTASYAASSLADGLRKRDQILGLANNFDEPVIPVTIDGETRINGYYRVTGAALKTDIFVRQRGNLYDYQVDLEAVPSFSQPLFESIMSSALLSNVVGAVGADVYYWHAVPSAVIEYFPGTGVSAFSRSSEDGTLKFMSLAAAPPTIISFALAPANHYIGAAKLEQGAPLLPVVGRLLVQQDLTTMRLSNGLVRVTTNATLGKMDVSHWNGVSWSAVKTYRFTMGSGGLIIGLAEIYVLRNTPEEVIIRLGLTPTNSTYNARIFLDLALRRGDRLVRGYVTSDIPDTLSVARDVTEAATAITYGAVTLGGIRATANDSDGNRYVLLSYQQAVTSDLVNGKLTVNVGTKQADFAFGSEIGGSAAVNPDNAVSIAKQYLAVQSESQRIVSR